MTTISGLADSSDPAPHGYTDHASGHLARLNKVEGQVRGVTRMVADERYCIGVLTQISAVTRALLRRPKGGLVEGSMSGGDGDRKARKGATPGMQHCTTASLEVVKLAVPSQEHAGQTPNPYQTRAGPVPVGTLGRAPPDLSLLSQLRIQAAPTAPVCRRAPANTSTP